MDPRELLVSAAKADTVEVWTCADIDAPNPATDTLLPVASLNLPAELPMAAIRAAATGQSVLGHLYTGSSFDFEIVLNGMTDELRRTFNNLGAASSTTHNPRVGSQPPYHALRVHDPALAATNYAEDLFLPRVQYKGVTQTRAGGPEQAQWTVRATACVDPVTGNSYRLGPVIP